VEVTVTMHEHADETLDTRPPQLETNVGNAEAVAGTAVNERQN
jgi:hypothetical protein